jgi:hypothetical protein
MGLMLDTAQVFTNERNEVVFADRNFYRLLRREDTESLIGERLHRALGLPDDGTLGFLRQVFDDGFIRDTVLEFNDRRGMRVRVTATGRTATDDRGNFIGANLELWGAVTVLTSSSADEEEIIEEIPAQIPATTEIGIVQGYLVAQMTALYVMLMRSLGQRVCDRMDEAVTKAAKRAGVAANMRQGLLDLDIDGEDVAAYPALLEAAMHHASDMIGARFVDREMKCVDDRMDERTLGLARLYGFTTA